MNRFIRVAAAALLLACAGCSTVIVDRASGAATTGQTYASTLKQVNALALDKSLDFSAGFLAGNTLKTPELLEQTTKAQKERVRLVGEADAYLDALADYFAGLEALSKGDASDATAAALGSVADSLKNEPFNIHLSDDRKAALTGLSSYVAKQAHAASMEKALRRDADVVAQAIALSDEILGVVSGWIEKQASAEAQKAYQDKVAAPFTGNTALGSDWQTAWKDYVRGPEINSVLADARKASKDMQRAWTGVLSGSYSFDEVLTSLRNVQTGLDAASALVHAK